MPRFTFALALFVAIPLSAHAGESKSDVASTPSDKADKADKAPDEKKICRRAVATGSIMSRRICHTRAEWEAINGQGASAMEESRNLQNTRAMGEGSR